MLSKVSQASTCQLLRIPQAMQMLSRETTVSLTSQEMKRRSSQKLDQPNHAKKYEARKQQTCLNLIKLGDKDQFLQVSSSFQGIQTFSMDIVSLVVILDIRL
jgi:hypothetical protein